MTQPVTCSCSRPNCQKTAELKLLAADLSDLFPTLEGYFGDAAVSKTELAHAARIDCDAPLLVIGDSPKDLEAAVAIDASCILVATGSDSYEELRALGADVVLRDLTSADPIRQVCHAIS